MIVGIDLEESRICTPDGEVSKGKFGLIINYLV